MFIGGKSYPIGAPIFRVQTDRIPTDLRSKIRAGPGGIRGCKWDEFLTSLWQPRRVVFGQLYLKMFGLSRNDSGGSGEFARSFCARAWTSQVLPPVPETWMCASRMAEAHSNDSFAPAHSVLADLHLRSNSFCRFQSSRSLLVLRKNLLRNHILPN